MVLVAALTVVHAVLVAASTVVHAVAMPALTVVAVAALTVVAVAALTVVHGEHRLHRTLSSSLTTPPWQAVACASLHGAARTASWPGKGRWSGTRPAAAGSWPAPC